MENPLSPMSSEAPVSSPLTPHHQHMVLETPHPHNEDQEGFLYYSRGNNLNTPLKRLIRGPTLNFNMRMSSDSRDAPSSHSIT